MRFPSQFTQPAPTINSPGPISGGNPFADLVGGPRTNADFYDLSKRGVGSGRYSYNPTQKWVLANRTKFSYQTARATIRINPYTFAAGTLVGIVAGIITRQQQTTWDFTGYTNIYNCGPVTYYTASTGGPTLNCTLPSQANANTDINNVVGRPANVFGFVYLQPRTTPPNWHDARGMQRWQRTVTTGPNVKGSTPAQVFTQDPWTQNGANPGAIPLTLGEPYVTLPRPWGEPGVGSHPDEVTSGQPRTQPVPKPGKPPTPGKPGANTKEKKMRINVPWLTGKISAQSVAHLTTEGLDALECLWKALPKKYRTKPTHRLGEMPGAQSFNPNALVTRPQERINDVYTHWSKIDWAGERNPDGSLVDASKPGALACLVANHFTDEIIGRIAGGSQTEATKRDVILGLLG